MHPVTSPSRRALAVGALAAALVAAPALPVAAAPDLPTYLCSDLMRENPEGTVWDVMVRGHVIADAGCSVLYSNVVGDLTVLPDGDLDMHRSGVHGELAVAGPAYVRESEVHGDVSVATSGTVAPAIAYSWVGGSVRGTADELTLGAVTVTGDVDVDTTRTLRLWDVLVGGSLDATGGRLIAHRTTVTGNLTSTGATDVLVCRGVVGGDLTVAGVQGWSRVGEERRLRCHSSVAGSVRVVDNPHTVVLGDLAVAGDLVCTGNTGPRGVVLRDRLAVAGTRSGQCARP
ncbi:hypothetical protein [Cellulomonas sp. NS3]|uniref:hypothetical protein n=1 Tax=Cellulomonas sp. NS3 TaxID=2973977 RepID=UPI002162C527|nr:hypothetical protein [Cellulomonas sp. NS3]